MCNGEPDCQRVEDEKDCSDQEPLSDLTDHGCPEPNYRCADAEKTCMPKRLFIKRECSRGLKMCVGLARIDFFSRVHHFPIVEGCIDIFRFV